MGTLFVQQGNLMDRIVTLPGGDTINVRAYIPQCPRPAPVLRHRHQRAAACFLAWLPNPPPANPCAALQPLGLH